VAAVGFLVAVGVACGSDNAATKDELDLLRRELREYREHQVLMERRMGDLDTRMTLLGERVAGRVSAAPAASPRPNLDVVRVGPASGDVANTPAPWGAGPVTLRDAPLSPDPDDSSPRVEVDHRVLADGSGAEAGDSALASQNEEQLARTDPKSFYNLAMRSYRARQYAAAARGFEEVSDRWPEHPLADNAVYWTGVCYLAQGEVALAINELQKVPVRYPRSDKVPDALLQLAEAYQRVGDKESAKAMLTQVVEMYPRAEAAGPAREGLARLK
jgi:tol-pal system protein YbgF